MGKTGLDRKAVEAMERRFPHLPWRAPVQVTVFGEATVLACRFCIAALGLTGEQVRRRDPEMTFEDEEAHARHLREVHGVEQRDV